MLVTAVIPAFNEGQRIGSTVKAVTRYVDEVLVIDDGSRDDTASQAAAVGGIGANREHQADFFYDNLQTPAPTAGAVWAPN